MSGRGKSRDSAAGTGRPSGGRAAATAGDPGDDPIYFNGRLDSTAMQEVAGAVGSGTHRLVAVVHEAGLRQPAPGELIEILRSQPLPKTAFVAATRQALLAATASYFRFFAPGPDWRLLGYEVAAPGVRFDLVFGHAETGEIVIDELKTRRWGGIGPDDATVAQIERYLKAGNERYEAAFGGVRLLFLNAPSDSRFFTADGHTAKLAWEQQR